MLILSCNLVTTAHSESLPLGCIDRLPGPMGSEQKRTDVGTQSDHRFDTVFIIDVRYETDGGCQRYAPAEPFSRDNRSAGNYNL